MIVLIMILIVLTMNQKIIRMNTIRAIVGIIIIAKIIMATITILITNIMDRVTTIIIITITTIITRGIINNIPLTIRFNNITIIKIVISSLMDNKIIRINITMDNRTINIKAIIMGNKIINTIMDNKTTTLHSIKHKIILLIISIEVFYIYIINFSHKLFKVYLHHDFRHLYIKLNLLIFKVKIIPFKYSSIKQ